MQYDGFDHLRNIAVEIDQKTNGTFLNKRDFNSAMDSLGMGSNLTGEEKSWLFDNYREYVYEHKRQEAYERQQRKDQEEARRRELERQQQQAERARIQAEIEAEQRAEYNELKISVYRMWNLFKHYKYDVLGATTVEKRRIVDLFDEKVNSNEFRKFYEERTKKQFVEVSYLPGPFVDYFKTEIPAYNISTEWLKLLNCVNFDPKLADIGERKQAYEEYGAFFEYGAFEEFLVEKEHPEYSKNDVVRYIDYYKEQYKNNNTSLLDVGDVELNNKEIAYLIFESKCNNGLVFSTDVLDLQLFVNALGVYASEYDLLEIGNYYKSFLEKEYQSNLRGLEAALPENEKKLEKFLKRKYSGLYFNRVLSIITTVLYPVFLVPVIYEFYKYYSEFHIWAGIVSGLVGLGINVFFTISLFKKKNDFVSEITRGPEQLIAGWKEHFIRLTKMLGAIMAIDVFIIILSIQFETVTVLQVLSAGCLWIQKIICISWYALVYYKRPKLNASAKAYLKKSLLIAFGFFLIYLVLILGVYDKFGEPSYVIHYFVSAFTEKDIIEIATILFMTGVCVWLGMMITKRKWGTPQKTIVSPFSVIKKHERLMEYYSCVDLNKIKKKACGRQKLVWLIIVILALLTSGYYGLQNMSPSIQEKWNQYQYQKELEREEKKKDKDKDFSEDNDENEEDFAEIVESDPEVESSEEGEPYDRTVYENGFWTTKNVEIKSLGYFQEGGSRLCVTYVNIPAELEMSDVDNGIGDLYAYVDVLEKNGEYVTVDSLCITNNEKRFFNLWFDTWTIREQLEDLDKITYRIYYVWEFNDGSEAIMGPEEIFTLSFDSSYRSYEEYLSAKNGE